MDVSGEQMRNYLRARACLGILRAAHQEGEYDAAINFEDDWNQRRMSSTNEIKRLKVPVFDPEALEVI